MKRQVAILVGCLTLGCRQSEPPICSEYVEVSDETTNETQLLPVDVWYAILIPGTTRRPELQVPEEPRECSGRPVSFDWESSGVSKLPRKPLGDADLTLAVGAEGEIYLWARTDYFSDGTAVGPVALVKFVKRGVEVRGIGTLRAPNRRVRLRLEKFRDDDALLIASGEVCVDENACVRETVLVPLINQLFRSAQLSVGEYVGPAKFRNHEVRVTQRSEGWVLREEIYRVIEFVEGQPVLAESLQVRECEIQAGEEVCEDRGEHPLRRQLEWKDGSFFSEPSLWEQNP